MTITEWTARALARTVFEGNYELDTPDLEALFNYAQYAIKQVDSCGICDKRARIHYEIVYRGAEIIGVYAASKYSGFNVGVKRDNLIYTVEEFADLVNKSASGATNLGVMPIPGSGIEKIILDNLEEDDRGSVFSMDLDVVAGEGDFMEDCLLEHVILNHVFGEDEENDEDKAAALLIQDIILSGLARGAYTGFKYFAALREGR